MKKTLLCLLICFSILISLPPCVSFAAEAPEHHGATTVSGNVKYVYDTLVIGITKDVPDETITLEQEKNVTPDELNKAFKLFVSDYPECFWVSSAASFGYSYFSVGTDKTVVSVSPNYIFKGDALASAKIEVEQAVSQILSGMPDGDAYEKALYLHDALAKKVTYKHIGEHQTAYGALVSGKAVCAGYAAAYQLLLQKAGIKGWTVTGWSIDPYGTQVAHAWNVVWIDAATCVYTDVTWDDRDETLYHYYFNISKREIDESHIVTSDFYTLPDCNHENESYFDKNVCTVTESSTPADVAKLFGSPIDSTKRKAILYYNGTGSFSDWLNNNLQALYSALGGGAGRYSYQPTFMEKEIHIICSGNFSGSGSTTATTAITTTKPTTMTTVTTTATTKPTTVTTVTTTATTKPTTATTVTTTATTKPTTATTVTTTATTKPTTEATVTTTAATKPTTVTTVTSASKATTSVSQQNKDSLLDTVIEYRFIFISAGIVVLIVGICAPISHRKKKG